MMATKKTAPTMSAEQLAAFSSQAKKIDSEQAGEIANPARAALERHKRIRKIIANLKAARLKKELTLEQVGERSGVGKENLSRLENFKIANPTIETLLRVSDVVDYELLRS